jgi:hypothetical protein
VTFVAGRKAKRPKAESLLDLELGRSLLDYSALLLEEFSHQAIDWHQSWQTYS